MVPGEHHYRVLRGTSLVYSGLRETYIDTDPGTGTKVYKLQLRTAHPGNSTQARPQAAAARQQHRLQAADAILELPAAPETPTTR